MSYHEIDYSVRDGILVLTLDRPDELNAFTPCAWPTSWSTRSSA